MIEENEIWKPVQGYEDCYEVSNFGRVKGIDRIVKRGNGSAIQKGVILKPQHNRNGYLYVNLYTYNTNKMKTVAIHRLVANEFVENPAPEVYNEVNHKDYNRQNNMAFNLEYVDRSQNIEYSFPNRRKASVVQMDKECNVINIFYRQKDAEKFGFSCSGISNCVRGRNATHRGYRWRYATDLEIQKGNCA